MPIRLPRLTLFSGPQCSLCDIAKAELNALRKEHNFELTTVDIQSPGQERWKRRYVYWIPALHLDNVEIAKGRWDANTVRPFLEKWKETQAALGKGDGDNYMYVIPRDDGVDDTGMELSEGEESTVEEKSLFFVDTSAMTDWPIPATQYITAVEQSNALGASPDSELYDEPPYDPDADYLQPGAKQCFNCMSTSHIVSDCPHKRDPQHISLARADYGARGGNTTRSMRLHEAQEVYKRRMEFNQTFEPGFVRGGLLRQSLGLNEDYNGGNEDLPWYFAMCDWGYPPGWVSDIDPRVKVMERIDSTSNYERGDGVPLLFIYEGDGPGSPTPEPALLDTESENPNVSVSRTTQESSMETPLHTNSNMAESPTPPLTITSADPSTVPVSPQASPPLPNSTPPPPPFPIDEPPPPPDFAPPPDDPAPPSPPPPDALPFPPRRWAHYRTTLFQSERLPISLVSRPLPALDMPPPPPSSAPPLPPPPPIPSDPPPPPPATLTEQEKRRILWEQIVAAQSSS